MSSDFIKEKIKDRPIDKKKLAKRIGLTVLTAVIFGAVSAAVFSAVYTRLNPAGSKAIKKVELSDSDADPDPQYASSENDISPDDSVSDNESVSNDAAVSGNNTVSSDELSVSGNDVEDLPPSAPSTIINNITNKVDITPEKYARLYKSLHDVAADASRSLVTVSGTTTDTDWFENPYESGNSTVGMIVADNGRQLLVLADSSATDDADDIHVIFTDGESVSAQIMNTDPDTGLQIIGIELTDIREETADKISFANLGSSAYASTVGTPVIAIGSPLGITASEAYGLITSMSQEQEMSDFNVHLLTTDIYGSDNASGVIIDYSGHVLGVITTAYKDRNLTNLITAYSISDIKDTIENLANGKERTYLGIIGTSVTSDAEEAYNLPVGAYVINVDPDSPALTAGIQSGDVITKIGTQDISDYNDYTRALAELSSGVETVITVQRYSRGDYTELTFEVELSAR